MKRVVVVRAAHQADRLSARLLVAGFSPVLMPVIAIEPPADGGVALRGALLTAGEGGFDWVVFTSSNAVAACEILSPSFAAARIAAIGPGTSFACAERGLEVAIESTISTAAGLLETMVALPSGRVLLPLADGAGSELPDGLRAAGWDVTAVEAYRTVPRVPSAAEVELARSCDAVLFTSSSSVRSWCAVIASADTPPIVVSIGPQTSQTARSLGLVVTGEADPNTLDGLVRETTAAFERSLERSLGAISAGAVNPVAADR